MKKTGLIAIALASMIGIMGLTACSGRGGGNVTKPPTTDPDSWNSLNSGETVQITLAGRDVDTEKANYLQFVNDFNATHDNIVVTLEWWSDATAYNIALDSMGKNLPDVFMLSNAMFTSFAAAGKLANIRPYMDETLLEDMYVDGYEVYYFDHETKTPGITEAAGLYGLPKDQGPVALAFNEGLLRERVEQYNAGASEADKIDLNRILNPVDPMNFDYFLEIGKKLKTVLAEGEYVCSGYDMQSVIYSNNANYFTDDSARTAAINSDNFVGAIEFIQDLYREGILPAAGTVSSGGETVFTSGKSLFFFSATGPWKTKDYWKTCDFDWNLVPVPVGMAEGAVSTAYIGGMCYAISNECPYKDAALELVKYLSTNITSQRTQYRRGQCIPNLISLAEEYMTDEYGFIASQTGDDNPSPANRSVWIDVVDGVGGTKTDANGTQYTDKVTGKYRAESFTLDNTWLNSLNQFMAGTTGNYGSFWEPKSDGSWVNVKEALTAYLPELQVQLDENYERLHRM